MIGAGRLDRQVQFLGRPGLPSGASDLRAPLANLGDPVWAYFKPGNAVRLYFGSFRVYVPSGELTARTEDVGSITAVNRVAIEGQNFQVRAVQAPDRRAGVTVMDIVGAQDEAAYSREMDVNGDTVAIRRAGTPATLYGPIRALIMTYTEQELTGNMQEGDRKVLMLANDVVASGIPLPILAKQDRLLFGTSTFVVQYVDETSHRTGGQLLAYELRVSGN